MAHDNGTSPAARSREGASRSHTDRTFSRRQLLGTGAALSSAGLLSACGVSATPEFDLSKPVKGGRLRVGLTGGTSADTVDAHVAVNTTDICRMHNMYEGLLSRGPDYEVEYRLATSVEPNDDATVWTAKLREGVKFSDGREMTSEDVIASYERIRNPDDPKTSAAVLATLDFMKAKGPYEVEFHFKEPNSIFDDPMSGYTTTIVPKDYDPENPVGTGPFMLKSFEPALSTVLERNPHYWDGTPHLDEIELLNFNDTDAVINALLSNQVDCVAQIPVSLAKVIEADERMRLLNSKTGMWLPFTMRVDKKPFDDERVRQAFRLVVDREQMINQVLSGFGQVGNDMFGVYDPDYPKQFPQRRRDVEKAKQLLAEAGYPDGLTVELVTAPIQSGTVEAAQVFAQQARDAGITVKIRRVDTTTFFGDNYLKWDFAQSFWYTRNFAPQADQCLMDNSPFNETNWASDKTDDIIKRIQAETDPEKRRKIVQEGQKQQYEEGGYIIWGFANQVDAYQKYVGGLTESATGIPLSSFRFRDVWIAKA
ncbi:ABC transporter substrate-binding protein [Brevibacterium sp. Marseille-P9724]|uniref:ABC transporter substrate-binding protein n=1 Tax=Brevibacterium sp. Marseille-P9724 TaxID=2614125 RepID=UPI00125F3D28|nr:ABC transporter substrate-binding protein [Brevibacterium sp. Marseille-P9724]